jgi:hypothetical protein
MSYLLKISKNRKAIGTQDADGLVFDTSNFMGKIMDAAHDDNLESAVISFYGLSSFAKTVHIAKNTRPNTVAEASEYADAHEYYIETLKEASTVVEAMLKEKYGNLVPADALQRIATFASEAPKLTSKKISKHMKSIIPSPRKETRNKKGGKHASN